MVSGHVELFAGHAHLTVDEIRGRCHKLDQIKACLITLWLTLRQRRPPLTSTTRTMIVITWALVFRISVLSFLSVNHVSYTRANHCYRMFGVKHLRPQRKVMRCHVKVKPSIYYLQAIETSRSSHHLIIPVSPTHRVFAALFPPPCCAPKYRWMAT
jgi:hypothetical protein